MCNSRELTILQGFSCAYFTRRASGGASFSKSLYYQFIASMKLIPGIKLFPFRSSHSQFSEEGREGAILIDDRAGKFAITTNNYSSIYLKLFPNGMERNSIPLIEFHVLGFRKRNRLSTFFITATSYSGKVSVCHSS